MLDQTYTAAHLKLRYEYVLCKIEPTKILQNG